MSRSKALLFYLFFCIGLFVVMAVFWGIGWRGLGIRTRLAAFALALLRVYVFYFTLRCIVAFSAAVR